MTYQFFRSSKININQRELIIYITPRILKKGNKKAKASKQKMLDKANKELKKIDQK